MSTVTQTKNTKVKDLTSQLKNATTSSDLATVLKNVQTIDKTCAFIKCKSRVDSFAIQCKHCNNNFCTTHGLPEIHGCGEAARREEKRKYLHPTPTLSQEKHSQAATKLSLKLKQMQLERKAKQGSSNKKKK